MTGCSPRRTPRPLDRATAQSAWLINQLATPGLGSLIAGRKLVGAGQLLLACAGFGLLMAWGINMLITYYSFMFASGPAENPDLRHELWKSGGMLFGAAWLWALLTSISLIREARANAVRELTHPEAKPPVIGGHPPRT